MEAKRGLYKESMKMEICHVAEHCRQGDTESHIDRLHEEKY